jgi:hypothetical protein
MVMTDIQNTYIYGVYTGYLRPLIAWLKEMTQGEKLMLIATLCFGAVGAYGTYLFYEPSRGWFIGSAAATGIELLYIGAAGVAVKRPGQRWLAYILIAIGALGSAYFGVMVSLKEALPQTFDAQAGTAVRWPSADQWVVQGVPAFVEGLVPAAAALLLSIFLHSAVSHRLIDADDAEKAVQARRDMKPFGCPFCQFSTDTPAKLWGHYGRCVDAVADTRSAEEKRAIVQVSVREGNERLVRG